MFHPTWYHYTTYINLEIIAGFTSIFHPKLISIPGYTAGRIESWPLNKGVMFVRFVFYSCWKECTTDINIDITSLAVIVESICPKAANFTDHSIIKFILHLKHERMVGVKMQCSYRQFLWQLTRTEGMDEETTLDTSVVRRMGNGYGLNTPVTYKLSPIIITVIAIILRDRNWSCCNRWIW